MSQLFDKIKVASTKRSTFDLSHNQVTTSDFGYAIPICYRDLVPNDDIVVKPDIFVRLAPPAVPFYGRIKCRVHHFFVPYRILYDKWDLFINQDKNNHTVPPYFSGVAIYNEALVRDPQINPQSSYNVPRGTYCKLMSNLGLNPNIFVHYDAQQLDDRFSAFPFLAYYRIWLDYFMDPSVNDHALLDSVFKSWTADGGDMFDHIDELLRIRNVCFKKDYFTTAKLNPQDGATPSSVNVDVNPVFTAPGPSSSTMYAYPDGDIGSGSSRKSSVVGNFTIEAFRAANSLQRYLERNNFVGTKIINRLLAHFGVAPSAERLDMAEFIGGDSFPIQIGDVTNTAQLGPGGSLGAQAGKGVGASQSSAVRYHAKEHGIFMSILSILPDTGYYQGVSRFWQKGVFGDALDYFTPEFENLGYQEILNKELYVPTDPTLSYDHYDPDGVFGYTPRYSEYKFANDVLGSDFVSPGTTPSGFNLDSWHLFRKLAYDDLNPIALNNHFVELDNSNNDYDRVFQLTNSSYDHFYFSIHVDVKATRPMDGFTAPALDSNNEGDGNSVNLPYGGTRL